MINGILRSKSSSIYIISMGEFDIFIAGLHVNTSPYVSLIFLYCFKLLISQRADDDDWVQISGVSHVLP